MHFVIAARGMFALLRGLGARAVAAAFGASVFVLCGPYLSLATKLPLLFSLSWMPLALHCTRKAILSRSRRDAALAALVLAMQLIIGEPTMAMQTWALIAGYVLWRQRTAWRTVVVIGVLAALVAAIQLVPALDFTRDSIRSEPFVFRVVANWSMPLVRPAEMFLPALFRNVTNDAGAPAITTMYASRDDAFVPEMYLGLFLALLAVAGILAVSRGAGAVIAAVVISIIVAAGEHTPLLKLLYDVHLFRSIRYPEKFILTAAFALIVWGALLFDRMLAGDKRLVRVAIAVTSIWLAIVALAVAAKPAYFGWQVLRAAVVLALLLSIRRKPAAIAVIVLTIADLWLATRELVPRMPRAYFDPPPLVAQLPPKPARIYPQYFWDTYAKDPDAVAWTNGRSQEELWWLYRNGLNHQLPARFGYEMAMDQDLDFTALKTSGALLHAMNVLQASHGNEQPFVKMAGATAALRFRPAPKEVSEASIMVEPVVLGYPRYVFADRIVRTTSLSEIVDLQRSMDTVACADIEPFAPAKGQVLDVAESPNDARIAVRAAGSAFLVMSVTAHRYWSATIDGRPAPLVLTNVAYQGIVVPAGNHVIEMRYRNPMIWVGAAITLLALLGMVVALKRDRRAPRSAPAR